MSSFLWPHGLQHARLPCSSPTPRAYSNSVPMSRWCHPTISSSVVCFSSHLQSFPASSLFKWVSCLHQVAKVLEIQLQHQSFQWIFRTDFWNSFSPILNNNLAEQSKGQLSDGLVGDLLAVQGTLKSLLQHHSSKASILRPSAFFIVQFSQPYMTTGKTIALTRWIFFGKVISLLFNMLCRLVITFLPRSKCLIISWLQLPSAVILELKRIKSVTVSTVSPSICVKWWDWMPLS